MHKCPIAYYKPMTPKHQAPNRRSGLHIPSIMFYNNTNTQWRTLQRISYIGPIHNVTTQIKTIKSPWQFGVIGHCCAYISLKDLLLFLRCHRTIACNNRAAARLKWANLTTRCNQNRFLTYRTADEWRWLEICTERWQSRADESEIRCMGVQQFDYAWDAAEE